jgi:hypothetical protein
MRIELVPDDELHGRPTSRVRGPDKKGVRADDSATLALVGLPNDVIFVRHRPFIGSA